MISVLHHQKVVVSSFRGYKKMVLDILLPPASVKGMKNLDRTQFARTVEIPALEIPTAGNEVNESVKALKGVTLKIPKLQPVIAADDGTKRVLLNPALVRSFEDLKMDEGMITRLGLGNKKFVKQQVTLTYDNYKLEDILEAIIGKEEEGCKSYTRIGHVVHLNIREHLLEYKNVIGQVIMDKLKGVRSVVNKLNTIDNTYRYFEMEIIAGDDDMVTTVSENKCMFTFDFSKVYWNSRLSTEHERLIQKFEIGSVIYDVCAGVGPFSIPAAKIRKCEVYGNDLNPESVKWLSKNANKNKIADKIHIHNLDGNVFLRTVFKEDFLKRSEKMVFTSHIVMNLPAMAVEFLPSFIGIFSETQMNEEIVLPTVHVYCFIKGDENHEQEAVRLVESKLCYSLGDHLIESFKVRDVAPGKEMLRVSFKLPREVVFSKSVSSELGEPLAKKLKVK